MGLPQDISSLTALVYRLLERIEKLEADNAQLKADNAALRAETASLKEENKELKARLAQNSSNSHKPACQEGYHKKAALPKATGKKRGGQPGHRGNTLQMVCQVGLSATFGEKLEDCLLSRDGRLLAFARSLCFTLQYDLRKYGGIWSDEQHCFR